MTLEMGREVEIREEFEDVPPPEAGTLAPVLRVFLKRPFVVVGAVIIILFILMAIFAPLLAPYDPNNQDLSYVLSQPTGKHLLGTDSLGRDILSRIIFGARISLLIGLAVVFVSGVIGMGLGLLAGYIHGGWLSMIIMRIIDALMAFPMTLMVLLISGILGGGIKNVVIALTIGVIPVYVRLMFGQVLFIKENDYIKAEKSMGASNIRIMLYHLLPNCLPPLIVAITTMLGSTILAEAGLSFLGVGIEAPTPSWGGMVNDGREYLLSNPVLAIAPGIFIILVVFGFNMVGDGIRDIFDPRLRDKS